MSALTDSAPIPIEATLLKHTFLKDISRGTLEIIFRKHIDEKLEQFDFTGIDISCSGVEIHNVHYLCKSGRKDFSFLYAFSGYRIAPSIELLPLDTFRETTKSHTRYTSRCPNNRIGLVYINSASKFYRFPICWMEV